MSEIGVYQEGNFDFSRDHRVEIRCHSLFPISKMATHLSKRRKLSSSSDNHDAQASGTNRAKPHPPTMTSAAKGVTDRSAEAAFASGHYKSSFFKLQLDELLADSRPNYDKEASRLQGTLHKLKDIIESLPDRSPKPALEAEKDLRNASGIIVPYPEPRPGKETKYPVSFAKPSNINVVGSFALRTGMKTAEPSTIDLAVTIPRSLFQDKDYVNFRYFHKRAYYIACVAAGIRQAKDMDLEPKFDLQNGDSLRPVIILEPSDSPSEPTRRKWRIRIITAIEDTLFPVTRTLPLKNNIRGESSADSHGQGSTAFYNGSLRSEATVALYHKYLHSAAQKCDSFRDACVLGRTWLKQRGFGSRYQAGGFGGFEWSAVMALLFDGGGPDGKPILSKSYSSYQLFKATMQFLARKDLIKPALFFSTETPETEFAHGGPTLYDGKRGTNLLYKMAAWSYAILRQEATTTLNMLNESRDDNFANIFIIKVDEPMIRFDRLLTFRSSHTGNVLQTLNHQSAIHEVVARALGNRVKFISLSGDTVGPWPVETKPPVKTSKATLSMGLVLDPEHAARVVDHGPSAEQKEEAASFRAFWGEKAELRRFNDGSILESLVWSDQPPSPSVVYQILAYILQRHFSILEDGIRYIGDEYDEELRSGGDGISSYSNPAFQAILNSFTSLESSVQSMDDVPLTVRHLAPASPLLRYSALRVQGTAGFSGPADVALQFESSARWPDDLAAIHMTKVAFLIKIGDSLESSGAATSCRVGLENESSQALNNAFLDVTDDSGVTFRLRIHHDREQTLLERQLKDKDIGPRGKEEAAYGLSVYKRSFIQAPKLTQAIRTLCTRFPLLSPTIRLVKYWFNAHLFAGHINGELIELLTSRVFTHSYPWEPPASIMAGFLRVLHFLSRWDWQQEPLIVNLGGDLDQSVVSTIQTRFSAWRSIDPAMNTVAIFAASDIDQDGVTWTQYEMPPKVVAGRMSTLAKASIKLLREKGSALDIYELFHTSLAPYDFVINLRSKIAGDRGSSSAKFKNLKDQTGNARSTAVSSFIRDLQACYGQSVLLFHGGEHSDMVAGLWLPQTKKSKNWSLKMAYSTAPESSSESKQEQSATVSINNTAILNEISRLGKGLIEDIEVDNTG